MRDTESEPAPEKRSSFSRDTGVTRVSGASDHRSNSLSSLHRATGNQAVQRSVREGAGQSVEKAVQEGASHPGRGPVGERKNRPEQGSETARERQPVDGSDDGIDAQANLTVSDPGTPLEREAKRVAEAVTRPAFSGAGSAPVLGVQRHTVSGTGSGVDSEVKAEIDSATNGGRPLPTSVRSFFEPRFGRDLGDVRVHTGADANRAARSIGAEAFTYGTDVVFRHGRYDPDTSEGAQLLAHELTHVLQQDGRSTAIHRQTAGQTNQRNFHERISGWIPVLEQPNPSACWATAATIMLSWRDQAKYDISEALGEAGGRWQTRFDNGNGLLSSEVSWFFSDVGLAGEPPFTNITVERIRELIADHGPLMVATDIAPGVDTALHFRVVVEIFGDGTPTGTEVKVIDPLDGSVNTPTFQQFSQGFEEEPDEHEEGIQILHW